MSYVANRFTVILDANVLHASRKRDVLLSFYEAGLFRARWTNQILEEVRTSLERRFPDKRDKINALIEKITAEFPESLLEGYEGLADQVELPDPDDKHVLSAAIRCGAQIIVSENKRDFPNETLSQFDIELLSADEFLVETFGLFEFEALTAIKRLRQRLKAPAYQPMAFIMDLTAKGLPLLAAELRERSDFI